MSKNQGKQNEPNTDNLLSNQTIKELGISNSSTKSSDIQIDEKYIKSLVKKEVTSLLLDERIKKIKIKKIADNAIMPTRGHDTDSGWDLSVIGTHKIEGDTIFFKTGLQAEVPTGHYLEIYPRSSISALPFMLANSVGIIDESYRGELIVAIRVLHSNVGGKHERDIFPSGIVVALDAKPVSLTEVAALIIAKKPRIAQMILRKRIESEVVEVKDLSSTERGSGGFGSTG